MRDRHGTLGVAALFLATIFVGGDAHAQKWADFPDLRSAQHVGVERVSDGKRYDDLRDCMRGQRSQVGADYYATLVGVTHESGRATRQNTDATDYAKAQFEAWKLKDKDILFAVGLRNRAFGVHIGQKWADLGLTPELLSTTAELTQFAPAFTRRNYDWALCSLAQAIDVKLVQLTREKEAAEKALETRVSASEEELTKVKSRLDIAPESSTVRTGFEERHTKIAETFERAKSSQESKPVIALKILDEVDKELAELDDEIDVYGKKIARLNPLLNEIEGLAKALQERADADWDEPKQALSRLDECRVKAEALRTDLTGELEEIRACLAAAEVLAARGEVRHSYKARTIPFLLFLALLAVIAAVLLVVALVRRRFAGHLDSQIQTWGVELSHAEQWLEKLRADYPYFFETKSTDWQGASAEVGKEASDALNLAYFLIGKGQEWRSQAKGLLRGGPLSLMQIDRGLGLLSNTKAEIQPGDPVRESPLQTVMTTAYSEPARRVLADLENALLRAQAMLFESGESVALGQRLRQEGSQKILALQSGLERRKEFGLGAPHLEAELGALAQKFQTFATRLEADPLSAKGAGSTALFEEIERLQGMIQDGNLAVERLAHVEAQVAAVDEMIAALKHRGFSLKEPEFDADAERARLVSLAGRARAAFGAGKEKEGQVLVDNAQGALESLTATLQDVQRAPEYIQKMSARLEELREHIKADYLNLRINARNEEEALNELNHLQSQVLRHASDLSQIARLAEAQRYVQALQKLDGVIKTYVQAIELINSMSSKPQSTLHGLVQKS
ncbi:hypothetical protein FRD01_15170 [Microvenator marinus]|uniref:Uncharacterized protein n=1 Tax=Microvenator marinus TaxID=2600177 RepID=A0A5B8XYM7_9DELT|nr:TPM domain-containing protein [Microvenator marinus]QED28549.1 hypothetical protein FRD01_15170 [Microvenator marinus]